MAEGCPLRTQTWDGAIPGYCREQCETIWERVSGGLGVEDHFPHDSEADCRDSDVEYGGENIQPLTGAARLYSILHTCRACGDEAYSESYPFTCAAGDQPKVTA